MYETDGVEFERVLWYDHKMWREEERRGSKVNLRSITLVQASTEVAHTISWSVSADSVYIIWQARSLTLLWSFMPLLLWLVMLIYSSGTPASSCYDFLLNIAFDSIAWLVHYVYSTSQWYCMSLLGSALYILQRFIVLPAECIVCWLVSLGEHFQGQSLFYIDTNFYLSIVLYDHQSNYGGSFHLPWWPRRDSMLCFELFVCTVCFSKIKDKTKHTHHLHSPFQLSGEHNGCGWWPCYILYRHGHH